MPAKPDVYEGSCFCGKVRYRVRGPLGSMSNCFCTDCRKSNAAVFATYIDVRRKDLTWVSGEEHLATYKAPSGTVRGHCSTCGSTVACWTDGDKDMLEIAAPTLDTPIERRPEYHIFVRSKPSWYDIQDGRPQHAAYPGK